MQRKKPKIRSAKPQRDAVYRLGEFPEALIRNIARHLAFLVAVNNPDISGDQWGTAFAAAVGGDHLASNVSPHDIAFENCAWSAKTVKRANPFTCKRVPLISGRNSPEYSVGMENPFDDPQATGDTVLDIWNSRIDVVLNEFDDYRQLVLIRNVNKMQFALFEAEMQRFIPNDYKWEFNENRNLKGFDKSTDAHCFTWQPHGGQFTIAKQVPGSAVKFEIKRPPTVSVDAVLDNIKYDDSWVTIHD